jgi:hypothetical protein
MRYSLIVIADYVTLPTLLAVMALRQGKALTWDPQSRNTKAV